jgi:hypothetical protein
MTDLAPELGVLAGLLGVATMVPYVRDTIRGATRPHRGTWVIWTSLAIVVWLSQRADGASWSLLLASGQVLLNGVVVFVAVRRGEGGVSATDTLLLALAGAGVVGWLVADEPSVAIGCVIVADLIAIGLMAPKTYRDPSSETLAMYAGAGVAGALAAGAVGALDVSLLLYPVYYCVVNLTTALLIAHRRGVVLAGELPQLTPRRFFWTLPISLRGSASIR